MFTLEDGAPVGGVPVLHATLFIPEGGTTPDQITKFKQRWHDIYTGRKARFIFVVDITHPSLQTLEAAWVVSHVVDVLRETRPIAERSLEMTVIVTGSTGRRLITMVDAMFKLLPYITTPSLAQAAEAAELEFRRREAGVPPDPWWMRMLQ